MLACTELITMCLQSAKHEHLRKRQELDHKHNQGISLFQDVSTLCVFIVGRFKKEKKKETHMSFLNNTSFFKKRIFLSSLVCDCIWTCSARVHLLGVV